MATGSKSKYTTNMNHKHEECHNNNLDRGDAAPNSETAKPLHFTPEMLQDQELLVTTMNHQGIPEPMIRRQFERLLEEQWKQLRVMQESTQKTADRRMRGGGERTPWHCCPTIQQPTAEFGTRSSEPKLNVASPQHHYHHQQHQYQPQSEPERSTSARELTPCENSGESDRAEKVKPSSLLRLRLSKEELETQKRNNGLQDPSVSQEILKIYKSKYRSPRNSSAEPVCVRLNGTQERSEMEGLDSANMTLADTRCRAREMQQLSANGLENQRNPLNPQTAPRSYRARCSALGEAPVVYPPQRCAQPQMHEGQEHHQHGRPADNVPQMQSNQAAPPVMNQQQQAMMQAAIKQFQQANPQARIMRPEEMNPQQQAHFQAMMQDAMKQYQQSNPQAHMMPKGEMNQQQQQNQQAMMQAAMKQYQQANPKAQIMHPGEMNQQQQAMMQAAMNEYQQQAKEQARKIQAGEMNAQQQAMMQAAMKEYQQANPKAQIMQPGEMTQQQQAMMQAAMKEYQQANPKAQIMQPGEMNQQQQAMMQAAMKQYQQANQQGQMMNPGDGKFDANAMQEAMNAQYQMGTNDMNYSTGLLEPRVIGGFTYYVRKSQFTPPSNAQGFTAENYNSANPTNSSAGM